MPKIVTSHAVRRFISMLTTTIRRNLVGPDTDANILIETFDVYQGRATRRAVQEAKEWWNDEINRQTLRIRWKELNERD